MSKIGVGVKIDVSKIDKQRLFKGEKGTYLDATVFIDLDQADQYGHHGMVTQDVSKQEKDQGVQGPILGNVKIFWRDHNALHSQQPAPVNQPHGGFNNPPPAPQQPARGGFDDFSDDVPL